MQHPQLKQAAILTRQQLDFIFTNGAKKSYTILWFNGKGGRENTTVHLLKQAADMQSRWEASSQLQLRDDRIKENPEIIQFLPQYFHTVVWLAKSPVFSFVKGPSRLLSVNGRQSRNENSGLVKLKEPLVLMERMRGMTGLIHGPNPQSRGREHLVGLL